jgi:anti-sigma B factor antagonist
MENPIQSAFAEDGTATVTVHGEIDFSNADDLSQGIRNAITEWSPATVRVDLKDATLIDSTGLGALIEGFRAATDSDSDFVVVNASATFRRVLSVTGLCDLFGLTEQTEIAGQRIPSPDLAG